MQVKELLLPFGSLKAFNLVMDKNTGNSKVRVSRLPGLCAARTASGLHRWERCHAEVPKTCASLGSILPWVMHEFWVLQLSCS